MKPSLVQILLKMHLTSRALMERETQSKAIVSLEILILAAHVMLSGYRLDEVGIRNSRVTVLQSLA